MSREVLIELGCEEMPAAWLPELTPLFAKTLSDQLRAFRLDVESPIEGFSTPRRLTAWAQAIAERQTDLEEAITGPPVSAAFTAAGEPTPAGRGFAKKYGVDVAVLERVDGPKGAYLVYRNKQRGKAAVDVLSDVLAATLRALVFPKPMSWDARLDDGRGALPFGRPIRWILFLYGGRVVPFTIRRTDDAQSSYVQDVRSGAVTYGHRFLTTSGRAGRAIKVRNFEEYRARLAEHFVILARRERHGRIARELDAHARRLGGRVGGAAAGQTALLEEVPDLVEYPSVVVGSFNAEFLSLPDEVLATTMIHHQHYFPVSGPDGRLLPAFLAVTNTEPDNAKTIARNSERVLTARLRDARFFWQADRQATLESRLDRLGSVLFHKRLGTYLEKTRRIERLAAWIASDVFGAPPERVEQARLAGRLAKADLVTDMVREFTELQGVIGGIYAREEGLPAPVCRAIYHQYQPHGVEPDAAPTRADLGDGGDVWAAAALADRLDSLAGLAMIDEMGSASRDPFGVRRQALAVAAILADLPERTAATARAPLDAMVRYAVEGHSTDLFARPQPKNQPNAAAAPAPPQDVAARIDQAVVTVVNEVKERARYLFSRRGFGNDEILAVFRAYDGLAPGFELVDARRRLEALKHVRQSADFTALAVAFKRAKNLAREHKATGDPGVDLLTESAEIALASDLDARSAAIRSAAAARDYDKAFRLAAGFRPTVDRFFTEVFVMVDEPRLRAQRLALLTRLHELVIGLADISEIVPISEP